jgi:hypothetical protein
MQAPICSKLACCAETIAQHRLLLFWCTAGILRNVGALRMCATSSMYDVPPCCLLVDADILDAVLQAWPSDVWQQLEQLCRRNMRCLAVLLQQAEQQLRGMSSCTCQQ